MDQITTAIVTALSTAAALVGKEATTAAVKDAYARLTGWITVHHSRVSIHSLEKEPASAARQEVVAEELEREGATDDADLVRLAHELVVNLRKQMGGATTAVGVDLGKLDHAHVTFGSVRAGQGATGVHIDDATNSRFYFKDVSAGAETDVPKA